MKLTFQSYFFRIAKRQQQRRTQRLQGIVQAAQIASHNPQNMQPQQVLVAEQIALAGNLPIQPALTFAVNNNNNVKPINFRPAL